MNLQQQQIEFLNNNADVINWIKNNFSGFNTSMFNWYFLQSFYWDAVINGETDLNNSMLNDYSKLFWFWVEKRIERMNATQKDQALNWFYKWHSKATKNSLDNAGSIINNVKSFLSTTAGLVTVATIAFLIYAVKK